MTHTDHLALEPHAAARDIDPPNQTAMDARDRGGDREPEPGPRPPRAGLVRAVKRVEQMGQRSEEHTSELQSRLHLVCRLLLEKKKTSKACRYSSETPTRT